MATAPFSERLNVAITEEMKAGIRRVMDRRGARESEVVRAAVAYYLKREQKPRP